MENAATKVEPPGIIVSVICGLLVAFFALMATLSAWPAIAAWLPQETVAVDITDSDARLSGFSDNRTTTASAGYNIRVVDEDGTRQNISCPKDTYTALTKGFGIAQSVKLVRNPTFKTPVAFLRQSESIVTFARSPTLENTSPKNPGKPAKRLPIVSFLIFRFVCGLLLMALAGFMVFRLLKFQPNRVLTMLGSLLGTASGISLGIWLTSGL